MDKAELIQCYATLLEELNEPAGSVVVSSSAALVMMGLRDSASKLTVNINENVFRALGNKFQVKRNKNINLRIQYNPLVYLHILAEDTGIVCIEGVYVLSPRELLVHKRHLVSLPTRREDRAARDAQEIKKLEELMRNYTFTARSSLVSNATV